MTGPNLPPPPTRTDLETWRTEARNASGHSFDFEAVELSRRILALLDMLEAAEAKVAALNRRVDALQKSKPAFLTDFQRMWDLVRHQRSALYEAGLLTAEEYALLVGSEDTSPHGQGSPSPRRLESYDAIRAELQRLKAGA